MGMIFQKPMSDKSIDSDFDTAQYVQSLKSNPRMVGDQLQATPDSPEADLWRAVLMQGLRDHVYGKDTGWVGSRGYREICERVNMNPDAVEAAIAEIDPENFHYQHLKRASNE